LHRLRAKHWQHRNGNCGVDRVARAKPQGLLAVVCMRSGSSELKTSVLRSARVKSTLSRRCQLVPFRRPER